MNPLDLKGKTALVTGGNGGIGLGIAKGLAQAGAKVALAGRNEAKNQAALTALGGDAIAVGGAAACFCSRASDFVTGTARPVDGGFSSSMF